MLMRAVRHIILFGECAAPTIAAIAIIPGGVHE